MTQDGRSSVLAMVSVARDDPGEIASGRAVRSEPGDMSIRDSQGILSTVLYGPDQRTRLRPETRSVVFTVYAPSGISDADLDRHLRRIESLVRAQSPSASTAQIGIRRA